ncbi:MAG: hypothetical protein WAV31_03615 [Candidatus Moraniibacteriota bacterium]
MKKAENDKLPKLPKGCLRRFYAVTMTSLYEVGAMGEDCRPFAKKIALKEESEVAVGKILSGSLLAIAPWLQFYNPQEKRLLFSEGSSERRLDFVPFRRWGMKTSDIVALFRTKKKAQKCFSSSDLKQCDSRWIKDTIEVVGLISEDHPTITVCHLRNMELLKINLRQI